MLGLGMAVYGLSQSVQAFNKEPSWGNLLAVALSAVGVIASAISVIASVRAVVAAAKAASLLHAQQTARPAAKTGKTADAQQQTLYHYTDEKGMNGIVESKQLNPSLKANNPKDARYGDGQYLSDIVPGTKTPAQLSRQFINVPNKYKYTHYVEIDVRGLNVIQGRTSVYLIPNSNALDLTGRIVSFGKL